MREILLERVPELENCNEKKEVKNSKSSNLTFAQSPFLLVFSLSGIKKKQDTRNRFAFPKNFWRKKRK